MALVVFPPVEKLHSLVEAAILSSVVVVVYVASGESI